jgi:hypothetical protein
MKVLKIIGGIIIIVCVLAVLGFFGLRFLFLGRFTFPSDAEFEAIAKNGQPIAQAICDYRSEHGLLPLVLSDVVPTYLPKASESGWRFDDALLRHNAGIPRSDVSLAFVGEEGWTVWGEGINRHRLNVVGPVSQKTALTGEALFAAQLAEYERRISHHPDNSYYNSRIKEYYGDKICFLGLAKRQNLLRTECERDTEKFPDWWLPQVALAESDELNTATEKQFVAWVRQHETFANYWYLARYYRDKGDNRAALAALDQAATSPYEQYPDWARWSGIGFAFDAAQFSYENSNYDLTIKLCQHCEPIPGSWEGCTLLEFVAAAELKQMQFEPAITNAQRVVDIAKQHPMQVEIDVGNLSKLLEAAKAHDTNFEYQPHETENPQWEWSLFVKPSP